MFLIHWQLTHSVVGAGRKQSRPNHLLSFKRILSPAELDGCGMTGKRDSEFSEVVVA